MERINESEEVHVSFRRDLELGVEIQSDYMLVIANKDVSSNMCCALFKQMPFDTSLYHETCQVNSGSV